MLIKRGFWRINFARVPFTCLGEPLPGEGGNVCLSGVPALLLDRLLALLLSLLPVPALEGPSVAGPNSSSCTAISGTVGGAVLRREGGREGGNFKRCCLKDGRREGGGREEGGREGKEKREGGEGREGGREMR